MRTTFAILAASLLVPLASVPTAGAYPPPDAQACKFIGPLLVACGVADAEPGAIAVGVGAANAEVTWQLVLRTQYPFATYTASSTAPAAALHVTGAYALGTCVQAFLYADGHLVSESAPLC